MFKRKEKTMSMKNSVGRLVFVGVSLLLQVGWIVSLITQAGGLYPYITLLTELLSLLVVINIHARYRSSASKISWIILILIFPVLGLCLYLLVGQPWATQTMRMRFENIDRNLSPCLPQNPSAEKHLKDADPAAYNLSEYLRKWGKYPLYENTRVEFHGQGEIAFEALKAELRKAEKFIFMEYHAIEFSKCFMEIEEILEERVKAGVEVRLFYDDVGSFSFIGPHFVRRMEEKNIRCRVFNPLLPFINPFMNNRDHRKITVIDGKVGFTGGYNLADEYFNVKHPYGHWKDTGLKLTGDAVRSLTVMFLEMWNAVKKMDEDYGRYTGLSQPAVPAEGFVQPYADSPLDDERVGENVYLNLLKNAKRYCWITTPYLILDDEMMHELVLAAKRGVDVRIITPGIPDKKTIFRLTRSYYAQLIRAGVKIYEYTPGFIHAKQMLVDDDAAVVGTINLDYRSLYLHFENAVLFRACGAVMQLKHDFEKTFPLCCPQASTGKNCRMGMLDSLLRLFAPLL